MSRKPADNKPDAVEFEVINREIDLMMKRLHDKGVCRCCVAQGMVYRGAFLYADLTGGEEAVELCTDVANSIERPDDADMSETQH